MKLDGSKIKDFLLNFLIPLICLGATLLLFFTIIFPGIKNIPTLKEDLKTQQDLENQLRTKLTNLNRLADFNDILNENATVISRVLASDPDVPILLTQIDTIAKEAGLNITKLSYSLGDTAEEDALLTYSTVNVSLGAIGSYDQITTFFNNLENSARLVDVSTFRYATDTSKDSVGLFNATFVLRSPYLKVTSEAVTDEPINVDISDPNFIDIMDRLKELRFYDANAATQFIEVPEVTAEEIEESIPEEIIPESNVPQSEIESIVAQ